MQFGQLIEHKMRNIFLGKSSENNGGEGSPTPRRKKIEIEHISGPTV